MQKLLVIALAFSANFMIQWFIHQSGNIQSKGQIFGWEYNSDILAATFFNLKFVWFLLIVNIISALASKYGQQSFDSFVVFMLVFIAMAPISALSYNIIFTKEHINWLHLLGVVLIFCGAMAIAANKEILGFLK